MNYGLLPDLRSDELKARDYFFGDSLGEGEILQPTGQWPPLTIKEYQNIPDEKMFCVTASATNCCEMVYNNKYGVEINLNDAFTAKLSGTTNEGNTLYNVGQSLHATNGFVYQDRWKANNVPWNEFYAEVPADLQREGLANLIPVSIQYKYVPEPYYPVTLMEALKYSPLQITIFAYGTPDANGIYHNVDGMSPNHAVELIGYKEGEYWIIQDHYLFHETRKLDWAYRIGTIYKFNISKIDMLFQKTPDSPNVYYIQGGLKFLVIDMFALNALQKGAQIQVVNSLDSIPFGGTIVVAQNFIN